MRTSTAFSLVFVLTCALLTPAVSALSVPLADLSNWQVLAFRGIPANTVAAGSDGLTIDVNKSASPLVYPLKEATSVTRVRVRGHWDGDLSLPDGAVQGEAGADDFVLKLGLVESGDQTLNWFQRRVAPEWVRTLFALAPPGSGISQIHFLSTTRQDALVGTSRQHPLSDLLRETRFVHLDDTGRFELDAVLPAPAEVVALWISADGDDTGSAFTLTLESVQLLQ